MSIIDYAKILKEEKMLMSEGKYPYLDWYPDSTDENSDGNFYIFFSKDLYVTIKEDLTTEQQQEISKILLAGITE